MSIETRHAKSAKDRRLEYAPGRDGMAWFSAYLPADQAAGIWNQTTAAARAMQGPTETPDPDPAPRRRLRRMAARPGAGSGRRE